MTADRVCPDRKYGNALRRCRFGWPGCSGRGANFRILRWEVVAQAEAFRWAAIEVVKRVQSRDRAAADLVAGVAPNKQTDSSDGRREGLFDVGRPQATHAVGRFDGQGAGICHQSVSGRPAISAARSVSRYRALRTCGWVPTPPKGPNTWRDAATRASSLADVSRAAGHTRVIAAAIRAGANECEDVYASAAVETALLVGSSPSSRHLSR